MTETNTAAQDLVAALGELDDLARDKTAHVTSQKGSYSYTYTDLAGVLGQVRPVLAAHGFAVVQPLETDEHGFVCVSTTLVHNSGAVFPSPSLRMRQPDQAQLLGSTITYLRRYSLLAAVGLATEDDDGAAASKPAGRKSSAVKPAADDPPPEPGATTRMSRTSRPAGDATPSGGMTDPQRKKMQALFGEKEFADRDDKLAFVRDVVGLNVASSSELTAAQASQVIEALLKVEA